MDNRIFDEKSVEEIRVIMSQKGWISEDRLSDIGWSDGKYGYSIWFKRWDWHGTKVGVAISFHEHTDNLTQINSVVAKAALKSLKAWKDFPDSIPHQYLDGIKEDEFQTEVIYGRRKNNEGEM